METSSKEITERIIDYTVFFRDRGYLISPDFPERFFSTVSKLGIEVSDIESLEPLLRTMTVQSVEENVSFPLDFDDFIHDRRKRLTKEEAEEKIKSIQESRRRLEDKKKEKNILTTRIDKNKKKLESIEEEKENFKGLEEKKKEKLLQDREKAGGDFDKLFSTIKSSAVREAIENLDNLHLIATETISDEIARLLKECIGQSNGLKMMKHLEKILNAKKSIKEPVDKKTEEEIRESVRLDSIALNNAQRFISQIEDELNNTDETRIIKLQSYIHREDFRPGHAVQSASGDNLPDYFDKEFKCLTWQEKDEIKSYILDNARDFRTRMARNIRTGQRRKIDMAETCKAACASGGVPMRLCYEKPVRSKANLVMLLDVSGSCGNASEMMLYFMYCMHEVFPGGCKAYVFVNSLYDISDFLEAENPDAAIRYVFNNVPRKGEYSNYYRPLKDMYANHMSEINKDSLVFFIGDARNNKNESGEEFLKEICRRCKKAVWLNTEERSLWNQGDSIIGKYKPYVRAVEEVLSPGDLLRCVNRLGN